MAGIAIGVLFVLLILFGLLSLYLYRRRRARAVPSLSPALPLQDPDPERASSFFAGRSSYFFSGFGSTSGRSNTNTSTNSTYGSVGSAAREKYLARGPSNASTASTFSRQQSQRSRYGPNLSGLPEEDELAGAAGDAPGADANEEARLEQLYEQIAWPLGRKYGHTYDAFKLALTYVCHPFLFPSFFFLCETKRLWLTYGVSEPDVVFQSLPTPVQPAVLSVLTSTIARRLTPQPIKLRADIELTCYTPAGIDAIKKALRAGESQSTEAVPIKAKLVAPPLYVLSTNATDKVS